jgi:predicted Zn-dependent peptidase
MRVSMRLPAAIGLLLLASAPLAAQERIFVRPEAGTPVVAVEVLVAVGAADEAPGEAGIAHFTARAVVEPAREAIDSLGAHLEVEAHKDAVSFSLIAAPDAWREAAGRLLVALFRDPVDSAATVRVRRAIVRELEARESSPSDALARAVERAVFGEEHPWGRPAVGTARTVGRIGVAQVDAFLRGAFTPERTVVAVVGPVEQGEVEEALRTHFGEGSLRTTPVEAPQPAASPVRTPYDAITAWVSASWHFGEDADVEALAMLSRLALERVSFGPSRRTVYNARAEVLRHAGGGELRLHLVVPPREAEAWADRLREAVGAFAEGPLSAPVFADRLRRYRGERLLELETPEARARAMARNALMGGGGESLVDFEDLTAERLHDAARALDQPILVFLGPFEEEEGQ